MPIIKQKDQNNLIKEYTDVESIVEITEIPTLNFPLEVNENTTTQGTIVDYDENTIYTISCNYAQITYTTGATFLYETDSINEDLDDTISVQGTIFGKMSSPILNHPVTIINITGTTPNPIIDFPAAVSRNSITTGTITNHATGETYNISAALGTITNVSAGTFVYTAPNNQIGSSISDYISVQGIISGMEPSETVIEVEVRNTDDITPMPQINFPNFVDRVSTTQCEVINHIPGETYTIYHTYGEIINISGKFFDYVAPETTVVLNETLYIRGTAPGMIESVVWEHDFNILSTFTFDQDAINDDFSIYLYSNEGFGAALQSGGGE